MGDLRTNPTPYDDVNAILREILASARSILGAQFVGMYVEGSLALGDFDPASSDIDYVVVTVDEIRPEHVLALAAMHDRITGSNSRWATELEATYLPRAGLRRDSAASTLFPRIERGPGERLLVQPHELDWWLIHLYILREHGITLAGPPPVTLIDPIQPDELRQAMVLLMRFWWAPMLNDPSRLRKPGYLTYAVLTTGRMLYTLQHGVLVSKPVAARWAIDGPANRWRTLIERALAGTVGNDDLPDALALIQFTAEQCKQYARR